MGKDYTATGAKKWLITVGGFVLFVIIVVAIFLMIPANTKGMTETLASNTENFFIVKDGSETKYDEFKTKITTGTSGISFYLTELNDCKTLNESIYRIENFYNNYMLFAKKNNTLSSNYKTIQNNISKAQKYKKNMEKTISETLNLSEPGQTVLHEKMIVFRENFYNYANSYLKAFTALNKCYQKCFDESFSKNKASDYILTEANDYLYCIVENYQKTIESDISGYVNSATYVYTEHQRIYKLKQVTQSYLTSPSTTDIGNYTLTSSVQQKYSKIEKFFEVYKEKDFKAIIASINSAGNITKTYDVEDSENLYSTVKTFLKA